MSSSKQQKLTPPCGLGRGDCQKIGSLKPESKQREGSGSRKGLTIGPWGLGGEGDGWVEGQRAKGWGGAGAGSEKQPQPWLFPLETSKHWKSANDAQLHWLIWDDCF